MTHLLLVATLAGAIAGPAHSMAFWKQIAQSKYAIPAGSDLGELTAELTEMLASPDPELRDDIAYSTLAAWIYQTRVLDADALRPLVARLLDNLKRGVGEQGTDRVFARSFSALTLSVVVARDNAAPYLTAEEFRRIEQAALAYLASEQDLRGFDPEHGWMHSAAHTADLLKFIARNRFLDPITGQATLLDAIAVKIATAPVVFTHGEDERLARAVLSVVNRSDFDRAAFAAWTLRMKAPRLSDRPTLVELSHSQNAKNLLTKLDVLLDAIADASSEAIRSAHASVRAVLKDAF